MPSELFAARDVMERARLKPPSVYEFGAQLVDGPVLTTPELVRIIQEEMRG